MIHRALRWLGLGSDTGANEDDSDDGGSDEFTPSRLDASVLEAHGMGTTEAERELASVQEQARALDSERPDDRGR